MAFAEADACAPAEEPHALQRVGSKIEATVEDLADDPGRHLPVVDQRSGARSSVAVAGQRAAFPVASIAVAGAFPRGTRFGAYTIVRLLGEGGMGAVYEAIHTGIDKRVALKTMHADAPKEAAARFVREGKIASKLRHPNVVDITDVGVEAGTPFLVMEYLDGRALADLIDPRHPLPPSRAVDLALPIIDALAVAHRHGVVHRDLKPDNIFVTQSRMGEVPKLLDFGISKGGGRDAARLTATGVPMGTPAYMSPEQVRSTKDVDGRSDQFSFGLVLYEMLSGKRAVEGDVYQALLRVSSVNIEPLQTLCPHLPPALVAVVNRMLAPAVEQRFATMREVAEALLPFASPGVRASWTNVSSGVPQPQVAPFASAPITTLSNSARAVPVTRRGERASRRTIAIGAAAITVVAAAAGGVLVIARHYGNIEGEATTGSPHSESGGHLRGRLDVVPPVRVAQTGGGWFQVGEPVSIDDAAMAFRDVPLHSRSGFALGMVGVNVRLLSSDEAAASAVAAATGASATPVSLDQAATRPLSIVRVNSPSNLRSAPAADAPKLQSLRRGTLLVVVDQAAVAPSGRWLRVVGAEQIDGWIAGSLVDPYTDCAPRLSDIAADAPRGMVASIAPRTTIATFSIHRSNQPSSAVLATASNDDPPFAHVALYDRDENCGLSNGTVIDLHEALDEVFVADSTLNGGDPILIVATLPPEGPVGMKTWRFYGPGHRRADAVETLPAGREIPSSRRANVRVGTTRLPDGSTGYYPVVVRLPDGTYFALTWNGETLERETGAAGDATPSAGTDEP